MASEPQQPAPPFEPHQATNMVPAQPASPAAFRWDEPLFVPTETLQSFLQTSAGILPNSSTAYQENPYWQMAMRQDADTEGILRNLRVALAQLPWSIVPAKDYAKDTRLVALGRDVERVLRSMPRPTELWYNQFGAVWHGSALVNLVYALRGGQLVIKDTRPIAADTMAFDKWGNLGVRVGADYLNHGGARLSVPGWTSYVRLLDPVDRRAVFHHRVFTEAPDFLAPYSADTQFRGRGARDVCFPMWQMKMQVLRSLLGFCNTYANGGVRVGYYPESNPDAKAQMKNILANIGNLSCVSFPWQDGVEKAMQRWQLELLAMPSGTGDIYIKALEFFDTKIKESILGQSLSTEAGATGMGSGVAKLHGDSLVNTMRYHARACGESADHEVVQPITMWLGGSLEDALALHLEFSVTEQEAKDFMEAVSSFVNIGGTVRADDVRPKLGLNKPEPGDEVLERQTPDGDLFGARGE